MGYQSHITSLLRLFSFPIVVAGTQMSVQTEDLPANVVQATQNQRLHVEAHKEEAPDKEGMSTRCLQEQPIICTLAVVFER